MYAYKKKSKYSRMNKFNCKIFSLYNDITLHKYKLRHIIFVKINL